MKNNENILPDVWNILKEYISTKDLPTAAEHLVTEMIESGITEEEIKDLAACDSHMADAIEEHFEEEQEWEDEYT